ncbi:AEC family transporter [Helicobacter turcicus]|uniref:AEC family transporter n=1 Tax=Helicobacter turcicus TaxID=2867412 RepID=A0ABS7JN99_9HELI|nr:AEC family transporter [Helicobacter turcicus]MBX7490847.1 AEC family transporter [Helicobacter turcicus]MBX7545701.1 AEC family transporter [Helicobacter turcicus]
MLLAMYSIFVFIFIGYMANVLRLVGNKHSGILLGFLVNFALPAQIFNGTYHANVSLDFLLVCLISLLSNLFAGLFILFIGRIFRFERSVLITLCFMAMLGNTLYLGFPFVQGALGEAQANQVIIFDQFVTGIPFAFLAPVLLSLNGKTAFSFSGVLKRLFKSPLFLALICGALFRLIPFEIPQALFAPLKSLAQTATPVALFAIGVQLNLRGILEWKYPTLLLGAKMFIAPLLLFFFVKAFFGEFSNTWKMALIEVAMPPLVSGVAIIYKAGFNAKVALNAVTFGILVSFISIPLWLYFV